MPSINLIKSSDGTGNASIATVQAIRTAPATTIIVDTVSNFNSSFMGSMGTPHTFIDPVTNEEITVISEATAVDFTGHLDGANIEIDAIAPGYTDLGSAVGDVIIIKPTGEWANNVAAVMAAEHADDGKHTAITATSIVTSGNGTIGGALAVTGNSTFTGTTRTVPVAITSNATITPSSQIYDVTALAAPATIAAPSFTAANGQALILRIKDDGTARALTFAAGYSNVSGLDTPTTTTAGKWLAIGAIYNSAVSKWQILSVTVEA